MINTLFNNYRQMCIASYIRTPDDSLILGNISYLFEICGIQIEIQFLYFVL